MKRMTSMLVALTLWGCGGPVDFKQGYPTQDMVNVNMPQSGGTSRAGLGSDQQGLQGDPSALVGLTRLAVGIVNGSTAWILGALKSVTDQPATSVQGETAVWGPYTPALSATTWKLTVTRSGANTFNYTLEGKLKSQADTAYQAVLTGTHVATGVPGYGNGNFTIDWQALGAVGGQTQNQSASDAKVTYSRLSATDPTTVDVEFQAAQSGSTTASTYATYHYSSTPSTGGEFTFGTDLIAWWDPSHPTDHWSIKSRWQVNGSGRADAIMTGPNLARPATENECWDQNFASTYMYNSADVSTSANWGTATTCAFANADYAQ